MSIAIMTEVWKLQGLSGTEKLVLLALADNANDGGECFPSVSMLASKTCVCERAVRNAIRDLEAMGYVSSESRAGTSTLYRIHTEREEKAVHAVPVRRKKISASTRFNVFNNSDGKCHYCGSLLDFHGYWHVDHMRPLSAGGGDEIENLTAACAWCNVSKKNRPYEQFLEKGRREL